jgi:hypothetical protein
MHSNPYYKCIGFDIFNLIRYSQSPGSFVKVITTFSLTEVACSSKSSLINKGISVLSLILIIYVTQQANDKIINTEWIWGNLFIL